MQPESQKLITLFFKDFPRLDFLFRDFFRQERIPIQQKSVIYKETSGFIRLFPAYAFSKGIDPYGNQFADDLVPDALRSFDPAEYAASLLHADAARADEAGLHRRFGLPEFFVRHLLANYSKEFVILFLLRSIAERPLFLRKIGDSDYTDTTIVPVGNISGAYLHTDAILDFNSEWFKSGLFLIQDISSQLASLLVNPKPNQRVLDACAGSGGKTITLSGLMKGKGEITAVHVSERNRAELKKRLKLHQIRNVRQVMIEKERLPDINNAFDIVWIDAPCSGIGVIRRNPDLIYRLSKTDFIALAANQLSLLNTYSQFVKPGGRLVYSTCSVMKEENEKVIEQFLASSKISFTPFPFTQGKTYYQLPFPDDAMQTWGGQENLDADGFFICSMKRVDK